MPQIIAVRAIELAFAVWLVLSAAYQFSAVSEKLGRFDRFGLLPRWTFFAPNPGTHDHHIVYRECSSGDFDLSTPEAQNAASANLSPWRELTDLCSGFAIPFLWNPQRRVTKTVTDVVSGLLSIGNRNPEDVKYAHFTVEYFLLLHLTMRGASAPGQRQFAVLRTHGFGAERRTQAVFVSKFHRAE
jgi:hypothetical protein